ncbi:CARDB domain-containing protein [Streptomyces rubradiris]|uniref:CARDB domain-containing protein n=1 Tax=Streptomyces rubradiris TaxID=285531 RepID=A0ABQ3R980_STRRR|nr:CARDB domain-containing protein [Streptomyces rubradiris]GHI52393.1 hypothetical protein Srubr_22390 [Streptomyces rubradiris]
MSSVSVGRVLRRGACAGAVGALLVAGLGSGVAFADEPQTDQLWIQAPYEQAVTVGADGAAGEYRSLALGLYHDNSNFTVTEGRLTVDVSGLAGAVDVVWPDNCVPDDAGTVAVCDTGDVPTGYTRQVELKVRAAAGTGVGAVQGAIEYSAEATGGPDGKLVAPRSETFLTVGSGPDLGVSASQSVRDVVPGTTLTVPFSVTNTGDQAAHGFSVKLWATYGLDIATRYPQCAYVGPDADGNEYTPMTHVTCSFDTDIAPGATVELPEPLRLAVTGHALYERFDYEVQPGGGATDLDVSDNYQAWSINARNTADFAVHGTQVSGRAGDTVTAAFRFTNGGPAWVGNVSSGDPVAVIDFYLPEGTTATSVPDTCNAAGSSHYACTLPMWAKPGLDVSFPFQLRVDRVVPDATGRVVARPDYGTSFAFDPDSGNNSTTVTVNPSA